MTNLSFVTSHHLPSIGQFNSSYLSSVPLHHDTVGAEDLENRLRKFRSESLIFRSSRRSNDINSIGSMITVAIKVLTFLSGLFRRSDSPENTNQSSDKPADSSSAVTDVDRIDSGESLDIAMGTLMAFGGKYLRQTAVWLFDQMEDNTPAKVNSIGGHLENLSPDELEELATKAVAEGANPLKLQEAFVKAQSSGDWSDLEVEIASALGPESVGGTSIGGSSFISSWMGNSSHSGPMYYVHAVQNTIERVDKVISSEPDPEDPQTANVVLRFIKEFQLEKEAFALQTQVNKIIKQVNHVLGEDGSSSDISTAPGESQAYNIFGFDPFKYIFNEGDSANNKVVGSSSTTSSTVSEGFNPVFLASFGVLAALGTVAVGSYITSSSLDSKNSISKLDHTTSNLQLKPEVYHNGLYNYDDYNNFY